MLRVITVNRGRVCRLLLHGKLGGEWVPVVEQHWRAIVDGVGPARVTVVLSNVDYIDRDGERLLRRMADAGVRFVVSGCLNRYLVDRLRADARQQREWARRASVGSPPVCPTLCFSCGARVSLAAQEIARPPSAASSC